MKFITSTILVTIASLFVTAGSVTATPSLNKRDGSFVCGPLGHKCGRDVQGSLPCCPGTECLIFGAEGVSSSPA